jgi:hypothetical protein
VKEKHQPNRRNEAQSRPTGSAKVLDASAPPPNITSWPPPWPNVSPYTSRILWNLRAMLFAPPFTRQVWDLLLTDEERARAELEFTGDRPPSGIKMLMHLRNMSFEHTLIEVGHELSMLDEVMYRRVIRELGLPAATDRADAGPTLRWDAGSCALFMNGRAVRTLRKTKNTKVHEILVAFELAGWPPSISNPFFPDIASVEAQGKSIRSQKKPLHVDLQPTYRMLRSLNKGLGEISFHAVDGGQRLRWKVRSQLATAKSHT